MDDPKTVLKKEPRKSLFILLAAGVFTVALGILFVIISGPVAEPDVYYCGWLFIVVGLVSCIWYVLARRQRTRHD